MERVIRLCVRQLRYLALSVNRTRCDGKLSIGVDAIGLDGALRELAFWLGFRHTAVLQHGFGGKPGFEGYENGPREVRKWRIGARVGGEENFFSALVTC